MQILGIDPSFQGSGLAIYESDTDKVIKTLKVTAPNPTYVGIGEVHENCQFIHNEINKFLPQGVMSDYVAIEYPALATRSGAYLAILNGFLTARYWDLVNTIQFPPNAVDAYVHNKSHSKTYLVNYCFDHGWTEVKRTSHDICTAIILAHMAVDVLNKTYKNTAFIKTVGIGKTPVLSKTK